MEVVDKIGYILLLSVDPVESTALSSSEKRKENYNPRQKKSSSSTILVRKGVLALEVPTKTS